MKPRDTSYALALRPHHYKVAHRFAAKEGYVLTERLRYPTILARRGEATIGLLSTAIQGQKIIATNLILAKSLKRPLITAIRLLECYERVLWLAGVRIYFFELVGQDTPLQAYLAEMGVEPYHRSGASAWYYRRIE